MELTTPTLSLKEFVEKWRTISAGEMKVYNEHFIDVCRLVGAPTPGDYNNYDDYSPQYGLKKTDERQGYADIFLRGHFAIEYKGRDKYRDLTEAYQQLQRYRENLDTPPLLIVCDIDKWEIHTNFTNTPPRTIKFRHTDLELPEQGAFYLQTLRRIFTEPQSFHPKEDKLQITEDVAAKFQAIVDDVRLKYDAERIARFFTKLVFCLFVEDVGILTRRVDAHLFTRIVDVMRRHRNAEELFPRYTRDLFAYMATGGNYILEDIRWFNGSIFKSGDDDVFPLGRAALNALYQASGRDWAHVEPSIFGTIFERTLDESKRSQLGAHYTHPDDIRLIVEPVLMQPLRREWQTAQIQAISFRDRYTKGSNEAQRMEAEQELIAIRARLLELVRTIKVLDPACGSGNFLYISLRLLLDLEKEIITHPLWAGLPKEDARVYPTQLYGIEKNEIAHALASVVVWIGYIQWRYDNGFFEIPRPILKDMSNNIVHRDAILAYDEDGKPIEPEWAEVDVIVGNPPFLGGRRMRLEMDKKYVDDVRKVYEGRITGSADLVTYWFERARQQIEQGKAKRVGLLATNSIRNGESRNVLERIKQTGDIFIAWSDREWVLEGAAVRISVIGFDNGDEKTKTLDGREVSKINPDLTSEVNISNAARLVENTGICFLGVMKGGPFDIDSRLAQQMLHAVNSSGKSNRDVVKPRIGGDDIAGHHRETWIIDFGINMTKSEAAEYELPFAYVVEHVKPFREASRNTGLLEKWWLHGRPRPAMKAAVEHLHRYIATPEVSKYRLFVWLDKQTVPDHKLHVFAREDDYFFGVLQSRFHEIWSLRIGSTLGETPSYSSTRTFETFPFPFTPGKEEFNDPRVLAISAAAKALHEERHAWLNPPQPVAAANGRTLTNLYNALQVLRGNATNSTIKASAAEFAPRLLELHTALDLAVVAAYGWDAAILSDDEAILRNLLTLNGERAK